jgi:hypothetical protein
MRAVRTALEEGVIKVIKKKNSYRPACAATPSGGINMRNRSSVKGLLNALQTESLRLPCPKMVFAGIVSSHETW